MSFFIVKYGDNEEKPFNTNCLNTVLLGHIKASLGLEFPEPIDLASEAGDELDLLSRPKEYARKAVEPRSVCTLVKVVKDEDDGSISYVPLHENTAAAAAAASERAFKVNAARRMTKRHIQVPPNLNSSGGSNTSGGGGGGGGMSPTKESSDEPKRAAAGAGAGAATGSNSLNGSVAGVEPSGTGSSAQVSGGATAATAVPPAMGGGGGGGAGKRKVSSLGK
ncbi:hypothetical protein H9P43_007520 [Blastocladiella emersonii ATCC 22665]|nr:hypothetical protein H9P43_007520 [Blastocladiella emersonii ATCC 22665]